MKKITISGTFDIEKDELTEDEEESIIDEGITAINNIVLIDDYERILPKKADISDITPTYFEAELYYDTDMDDVKIKRRLISQEFNFTLPIKSIKIIEIKGVDKDE